MLGGGLAFSGNALALINVVALGRARLVYTGISWYLTKPPRPTQPGHPSMGRHNEY